MTSHVFFIDWLPKVHVISIKHVFPVVQMYLICYNSIMIYAHNPGMSCADQVG